jgi:hypothetical protein
LSGQRFFKSGARPEAKQEPSPKTQERKRDQKKKKKTSNYARQLSSQMEKMPAMRGEKKGKQSRRLIVLQERG